jgi:hypothetical protein
MKILKKISFNLSGKMNDGIFHAFSNFDKNFKRNFLDYYIYEFEEDRPQLLELIGILKNENVGWSESIKKVYSFEELIEFDLLLMQVRKVAFGNGGPKYGTKFDLSDACPLCGSGAKQISSLRVRPSDLKGKAGIVNSSDYDYLFSENLVGSSFENIKSQFRQVKSSIDGSFLPWWQLLPQIHLPYFEASSLGILRENHCHICNRDGYFHDAFCPIELKYDKNKITENNISAINFTSELFGNSVIKDPMENSHFAQPMLIVNVEVFKMLYMQKVKGLEFLPIFFV